MKQWDLMLGTAGAATTWGLSDINQALACIAGILTIVLLLYRVRREHKRRNFRFIIGPDGKPKTAFRDKHSEESSTT